MRKLFLIAAMVVVSASAQAGEMRNLSPGSSETPAVVQPQPQPAETTKTSEAPQFVERPSAVETAPAAAQPKADAGGGPVNDKAKPVVAQGPKVRKPKHNGHWTEQRIIGELHRHGVYW